MTDVDLVRAAGALGFYVISSAARILDAAAREAAYHAGPWPIDMRLRPARDASCGGAASRCGLVRLWWLASHGGVR